MEEEVISLYKKALELQENIISNHIKIEEEYLAKIAMLESLSEKQGQLIILLQERLGKYESLLIG